MRVFDRLFLQSNHSTNNDRTAVPVIKRLTDSEKIGKEGEIIDKRLEKKEFFIYNANQ